MRFVKHTVATLLLALAPSAALAQTDGFYLGLGAGGNWVEDADVEGTGTALQLESDEGWVAAVTAGYAWRNNLRAELELATRNNGIDAISPLAGGSGDFNAGSLMANLIYDFKTDWGLSPYIGLGGGMARVVVDDAATAAGSLIDDHDNVFAFQAIAGVSYDLGNRWELFADYRYFVTDDPQVNTAAGTNVDLEYAAHTAMLGLRYHYGAPPPRALPRPEPAAQAAAPTQPQPPAPPAPAAPAPAPEVVRSFLVFFGFDETSLTPEAQGIVEAAAANATRAAVTRITVTGHADRAGPDSYNQRLSIRRAQAVKDALLRLGIPGNEIDIVARGESDPLVPTSDGVAEPQNRRVEIVLE